MGKGFKTNNDDRVDNVINSCLIFAMLFSYYFRLCCNNISISTLSKFWNINGIQAEFFKANLAYINKTIHVICFSSVSLKDYNDKNAFLWYLIRVNVLVNYVEPWTFFAIILNSSFKMKNFLFFFLKKCLLQVQVNT